MDKYISRDAIRNTLYEADAITMKGVAILNQFPAADVVEVRHGRWLTKEYMYGDPDVGIEDMWIDRLAEQSDYYAYCSVCGKDAEYNAEGSLIISDYCPNCGAKMDGGQDNV